MIPGRRTDELLHALVIATDDIVFKGFDVLASLDAHQTGDVVTGVKDAVANLIDEMMIVLPAKVHESGRYSAKRRNVIFYLAGFRGPTLVV